MADADATDDVLLAESGRRPEAFAVFYRRHSRPLLAYLRYRTGDPEAAADLTAEVFAEALASRERYKPGREPARAWLFGIANNVLRASRRKGRREDRARRRLGISPLEFDSQELSRVEELADAERLSRRLSALVEDLPAEQRDAVLSRVVGEQPYRVIATAQGCSEAAVRQRVSRGLGRLAAALRKGAA